MREFPCGTGLRRRRFPPLLVASVSALAFLLPAALDTSTASATPSPGYTASYIPAGTLTPQAVAVNPATDTIYLGDSAGQLIVIDGTSNTVLTTLTISTGGVSGLAVDSATNTVYAVVAGPEIAVIKGATNSVTDIPVPAGVVPEGGIAVDRTTDHIYFTDQATNSGGAGTGGGVFVIDGSTNQVVNSFSSEGGTPEAIAFDGSTNVVWVANLTGTVAGIDPATGSIVGSVTLTGEADSVAVDSVTDTVYVTAIGVGTQTSELAVIGGSAGTLTTTLPLPKVLGVAVDPGADVVYATGGATTVLDGTTNKVADTIPNPGGRAVAVDTTTGSVYQVTSFRYPGLWAIKPSATSGVSPILLGATSATFSVGTASSVPLTVLGLPAPTLTVTGALPAGVTLSQSGTLAGTPSPGTGGVYPITITASNGIAPNSSLAFTLTIYEAPTLTAPAAVTLRAGVPVSVPFQITGYPPSFVVSGAGLPPGLPVVQLPSGVWELSGTPVAGSGGLYDATFQADNAAGTSAIVPMVITVLEAPSISSATQATFRVGMPGSFTMTATGWPLPTFSETGALPQGVSFVSNDGKGILSGTPAAGTGGVYPITVTASNSMGSATQQFTLAIAQPFEVQASQQSGFCLDNTGGSSADGNPIQVWSCLGNGNQLWVYVPSVNGFAADFQLENANGKCVDDPSDSTVNGTRVQLSACLGNPSQVWTAQTVDGTFTEYVNPNGLCLDNAGNAATDGNPVQVWACNGGAAQHWYGPSPQSSTVPPLDQVQASQKSAFCLDDAAGSTANGNPIQIWACLGNANQAWKYVPSVNGVTGDFQLENANGKCLDDPGDSGANGTKVQIWACLGNPSQTWTQVTVGSYTEYVNANGLCLDNTANSVTDGNRVQIWACNADPAQQWFGPSPQSGP